MVLDPLPVELIPFDDEMAYTTGLLLSATRRAVFRWGIAHAWHLLADSEFRR